MRFMKDRPCGYGEHIATIKALELVNGLNT